ncbi:MAG: ribosome biogenesis GTPase YlqF [Eubacteriales bacterium]|nr:ribosome biogenesis GTPase YlqF [Eubacteriales bacterium]
MKIQWFPGHMQKATRRIKEDLSIIDILIEIIDARAPISSRNIELEKLFVNKKTLLIINKIDLISKEKIIELKEYYNSNNYIYIMLDSRKNDIKNQVDKKIDILCEEIYEKRRKKGIKDIKIKALVFGMPNVGKSTFINSYVRKKVANTGDTPGVTKDKSWIRISNKLELLDTPGISETKFDNDIKGINLSLIGSIKDQNVNIEEVVLYFIKYMKEKYPKLLEERYNIIEINKKNELEVYDEIAKKNNCIKSNTKYIDYEKCAKIILRDFRQGSLGKISLE